MVTTISSMDPYVTVCHLILKIVSKIVGDLPIIFNPPTPEFCGNLNLQAIVALVSEQSKL